MRRQITRGEALAIHESRAWERWTDRQRAEFQLRQDRLAMPFDVFHRAVEQTLGRPVLTHEFGMNRDGLIAEVEGRAGAPSMDDILGLIPAEKLVVVEGGALVANPTRIDVVFECGAAFRNVEGPFAARAIADGQKPRKRDGRVSCVVYDSDRVGQSSPRRPTMSDGSYAPCRFGCPAKRASGRRETPYWPDETNSPEAQAAVSEDRTGPIRFPTYVTCYPSEWPTQFPEVAP